MSSDLLRWIPLVAGAFSLAACLGSTDRIYGSADGGPTMGSDATMDAAGAESGMEAGEGPDADAMMVQETSPAEVGPPADGGPPGDALPPADTGPRDAPAEGATGQTFSCNGQTVTSCANCANNPIECVYCANDGGHPGVCGPANQYCTNSAPNGAQVCNCPGGVAQCPAPFQVCTPIGGPFYCQTCGEMGSNNELCKGGGHCSDVTLTCQ